MWLRHKDISPQKAENLVHDDRKARAIAIRAALENVTIVMIRNVAFSAPTKYVVTNKKIQTEEARAIRQVKIFWIIQTI